MHAAAVLLAFVTSIAAYDVTFPTATEGWSTLGANELSWNMVSSDRANFSVFLTNEDRNIMPQNNQVLAALVDGVDGTVSLNPPSKGWPIGGTFRVNLCQDSEHPESILAQSPEFEITAAETQSGSLSTSKTSTTATTHAATSTSEHELSSTATSPVPQASGNAALPNAIAQGGLMGALAFLVALVA